MMNEADFDREFHISEITKRIALENADLLDRLGSDYDENGIPYWESMECECGKLKCPHCHPEIGQ